MNIVCLDLEGVLVPEIWIAFSEESGIPELRRTTRDEPDYEKLMRWRLAILKEHGLKLSDVQNVIAKIDPLPGAKEFLDSLREKTQAVILSDTFEEFAMPLMKKLGLFDLTPALCHLDYAMAEAGGATDFIREYTLASGGPYCDCGYHKKVKTRWSVSFLVVF